MHLLEDLYLPLYLITSSVISTLANLRTLRNLRLAHPTYVQWRRSAISSDSLQPITDHQEHHFMHLHSLEIDTTFDYIPRVLCAHPTLTSRTKHLSLSCLPPLPGITLATLFGPLLTSPSAFQSLTHLSLNFIVPIHKPEGYGLGANFFAPFLAAPFLKHLVSFHLQHRSPLELDDDALAAIVQCMPNLESFRLSTASHSASHMSRPIIDTSLLALVYLMKSCPRLKEIELPVDADWFRVPTIKHLQPTRHPVLLDLSISPIGPVGLGEADSPGDVARFLAALFPHKDSEFRVRGGKPGTLKNMGYSTMQEEGDNDKPSSYAHRWSTVLEQIEKRSASGCSGEGV
ncbi:hypothetical protein H0H81_000507 [Sphagnurus paluster]|uniref:Uncharacterized protein n=1 Tax=Sphagnurus paluster TaxID=117069 RepID=A0A9P7KIW6_9AGAR|nr:hypothetical protein H0H81_000507 [Sphagnurus paluster]